MRAASRPRLAKDVRILVVDGPSGALRVVASAELPSLFQPGDLLVVNDAATLPASFTGRTERGEEIELRLVAQTGDRRWMAALFGSGSFRVRTEDRPAPPRVIAGDELFFSADLVAIVEGIQPESSRLLAIELALRTDADPPIDRIWSALYRAGRPVQYAHVPEPLALWDVQNVYAGRPWAVEMPSAGRALRVETMLELQRRGVEIAWVTHAAGLSSVGDAAVDALLPLPERYEVTEETWEAIARARQRGGRVVAIGTSAARALEGGVRKGRRSGVTSLKIAPGMRRAIVDAVLTGVHEADTSHFALLGAFVSSPLLELALARAAEEGLLGHEMGDACLVWGDMPAHRGQPARKPVEAPPPPSVGPAQRGDRRAEGRGRRAAAIA